MARIVPAALALVCLTLLLGGTLPDPAYAFVSPTSAAKAGHGHGLGGGGTSSSSSSSRSSPSPFMLWSSPSDESTSETEKIDAPKSSSSKLDHEHSTSPTYPPHTSTLLSSYKSNHAASISNPSKFWSAKAREYLSWYTPFNSHCPTTGSLADGSVTWFAGGKLNVCYNALDRHVEANRGNDVAMVWEGDEPTDTTSYTFADMLGEVCRIANALKSQGVQRGDVVTIYMPMIPQLPMTMLACARIGAVHSVVFGGFSAQALAQRIDDASSEFVVTADVGVRGAKVIPLKSIVDGALDMLDEWGGGEVVQKVMVYERYHDAESTEAPYEMTRDGDVRMDPLVSAQRPYCVPEAMDAEDELFLLYTSGSTGRPKGLVHTTGGYALYAAFTTKTTFDVQRGDLFACVADCGWITGHTYVTYGPLLNGVTTFVFESTPLYPDAGRYWDMVERHAITHFYTAPTAIRSLMRYGDDIPARYDLSSLRVLGSVGEPINPEAWRWYYEVVGRSGCTVVDTYWQTETGGHVCTNIPGVTPMKPGSCALPMYGIDAVVLDPVSGDVVGEVMEVGRAVEGVLAIRRPWPGMARTCLGDHERFVATYLRPYPGYYFTDDAVYRDDDGYLFITGRCDDVLNVSGHRIGTAEVEGALVSHPAVAQSAVVARPHPIKGQSICAFATLKEGKEENDALVKELVMEVRKDVGPFAAPDLILVTPSLPMTRSGKIMRRILRKIVTGDLETLGDTSTLADPSIVDTLIEKMKEVEEAKK